MNILFEMFNSLKRLYSDSSELVKKVKYDEMVYYKDNLLLGLKRFCEVIEVYCSFLRKEMNNVDDDGEDDDNDDLSDFVV